MTAHLSPEDRDELDRLRTAIAAKADLFARHAAASDCRIHEGVARDLRALLRPTP